MHILIAPNAFKHSLTATEAADAIREGLERSSLNCTIECFPVGDGGDGTASLIAEKLSGSTVMVKVQDPLGREITSSFSLVNDGKTAVIEMADASGIRLLTEEELHPRKASTYGTGMLMKLALDAGAKEIVIGLGGSATVDGGAGLAAALGVRFFDAAGNELEAIPRHLMNVDAVDISGIDPAVSGCRITVLCDVDNYLLGEQGAVAIFGPQKGLAKEDLPDFEAMMAKLDSLVYPHTGRWMSKVKHGGAAGGTAAALYAFFNARLVNGAEHFLELTRFEESLRRSDLLITGEGSIDEQTLQGKAPFAVARMAKNYDLPVIGVAGKVPLTPSAGLDEYFDWLMAIGHEPGDIDTAIRNTASNLIRISAGIGRLMKLCRSNSPAVKRTDPAS